MKLKTFMTVLALVSASAYADVDYSRCGQSSGAQIDNDGQLKLFPNQKILNKKTEGNVERYDIETDYSAYGGYGAYGRPAGQSKMQITLHRDEQGRVIKVISGGEKLDKKEIEMRKKIALQMQVNHAVVSNSGIYISSNNGFPGNLPGMEPFYFVKEKNGSFSPKTLMQLSPSDRKEVGLSEDLYKELTQKWKKDKKSVAKIEKGLQNFQNRYDSYLPFGSEAEFEIKDGVCTPKVIHSRFLNSKSGEIHKTPIFTKESCEEVSKLYLKHKDAISKCSDTNQEIINDIWKNNEKIKVLYSGSMQSFGFPGMGMGGGMSPYGADSSSLSQLKSTCDIMLGEFKFEGLAYPKSGTANPQ